jgi:hypothetical protein
VSRAAIQSIGSSIPARKGFSADLDNPEPITVIEGNLPRDRSLVQFLRRKRRHRGRMASSGI